MSEPLRYKWTSFGPMLDEDGPFVTYAAHVEALRQARIESQVWHYKQGERDMLAKCIAAVQQALDKFWEESDADELGWLEQHELYVAAVRALEEKP